ncbi:response regulator [Candidatus Bathyarchaeota archaeon]|nr:MAG: response regulator [Candidatus Bathyarchaeota archaeon]
MKSLLKDKVKIVIIDDDELSNESLKLLLADVLSHKIEIHSLYSGKNAISEIEKNNYDIVFLDNKLPDISGLDILKEIKRKNIVTNVIFLTGYSDEQLAVKAMKLGATDYISKGDLDVSRLIEAVNEVILDSCSVLEIDPEVLSKIQSMFSVNEEIIPHQKLRITYEEGEEYDEDIISALDVMHNNKYVYKSKNFSIVTCPNCNSIPEEFYLVCPICDSYDIDKGEVIEHNKCHHIDFKSNFVDYNGNFVCPKCGEALKQIGVDYIRVGVNYRCHNYHIFPYPEHKYTCKKCGKEFNEDEANLVELYRYRILDEGKTSLTICDSITDLDQMDVSNEILELHK